MDYPFFERGILKLNRAIVLRFLISMLILVPAGIATKFYTGPCGIWIQFYFGGILYEIFWCILFAFGFGRASALRIAIGVFVVTGALECLQLWHPPFLESIRSTFPGRALIGTSFSWLDFPHYILGCLLGFMWIHWIRRDSFLPLFKDR